MQKWKSIFVGETSMDIVSMETYVTSDMKNLFAIVTFSIVKEDTQKFVAGINSMEDVNLHHFVSSSIQILKILRS